jgi:3-oxoacid CoA-transferase subunit A
VGEHQEHPAGGVVRRPGDRVGSRLGIIHHIEFLAAFAPNRRTTERARPRKEEPVVDKVRKGADEALSGLLFDGMTIMAGGFGLCGIPENLIAAIRVRASRTSRSSPTIAASTASAWGCCWRTARSRRWCRPMSARTSSSNSYTFQGELELEFNPQGTLAERIRAGGAGIPAFYTKTGVGTLVAEGKEVREFDGEMYVMERGLTADLAIVKAWKGDAEGNLVFRKTARNFNPMMATAGKATVVEVEQLVPWAPSTRTTSTHPASMSSASAGRPTTTKRIERVTTRPVKKSFRGAPSDGLDP